MFLLIEKVLRMTTFDRVKKLAEEQKITIVELEEKLGFGRNSLYSWKKKTPNGDSLQKVADYFNVSTDYLLGRTNKKYYELTDSEKDDIAKQADEMLEGITSGSNFNFYGEPATPEQLERIRVALTTAMEMNKEEAKKKFTPKKYRD